MSDGIKTSVQWMHSCYDVREKDQLAILTVKEKEVTIESATNKVLQTTSRLRQYVNPTRTVYITKPEYRTNEYKKEYEEIRKCDCHEVQDWAVKDFLKKELRDEYEKRDISLYGRYVGLRELCDLPWIYGLDISIEALYRYKYEKNQTHAVCPITIGSLDIESDMMIEADKMSDRPTCCMTVICDTVVYTAALSKYMYGYTKDNKRVPLSVENIRTFFYQVLQEKEPIKKDWDQKQMRLEMRVFDRESDMYRWIFDAIDNERPDYMFIWNLGFDVPQICARMQKLGLDPEDYFCSSRISRNARYLKYYEDRRPVAHIVQKWNWLHCTSETQWLDAMALYGQVRKAKPKETSYKLDDIMTKVLKTGKLSFDGKSHQYMQEKKFARYWVYNIFDALLVQCGTWKTQDANTLYMLTEHSTLMDFSKQTVMLCNDYHHVLMDRGLVLASTGRHMAGPYDELLSKTGGAVLDAKNVINMGVEVLIEDPKKQTNVLFYVADDDFKSLYPSEMVAGMIAKENKLATIVAIEGHNSNDVENFSSALATPNENAVYLAKTFFGLPGYTEIEKLVDERLKKDEVPF